MFVISQKISDLEQAAELFPKYLLGFLVRLPQVGHHYHAASGVMRSPQTIALIFESYAILWAFSEQLARFEIDIRRGL